MMKRWAVLGLASAALLAMAGRSEAHYVYQLSGWVYHSISCRIALKQVPSQDKLPGTVSCTISPTTFATVYCAVPGNNYIFAGQAAVTPVTVTGTLQASALEKTSGGVWVSEILAFNPVLNDFISACPNTNWSVVAVVLNQFDSVLEVKDSNGVVATRVTASCVIPTQYQTEPPPPGTQAVCNVTAEHLS